MADSRRIANEILGVKRLSEEVKSQYIFVPTLTWLEKWFDSLQGGLWINVKFIFKQTLE